MVTINPKQLVNVLLEFDEDQIISQYRRSSRDALICTFDRLEDPQVRLDDNEDYCLDEEAIGMLYAAVVETSTSRTSPGRKLVQVSHLGEKALQDWQKNFQTYSRSAMARFQGHLELRKFNREILKEGYGRRTFIPEGFSKGSLEYEVSLLAQQGNFEKIGDSLKKGGEAYWEIANKKGMRNYKFAVEYKQILDALKR
jgi:hypothetical protein